MSSFFLHPGIAWAALGLISIPIIIHLIHRRRFRKMDWAAMEFLLEALKKNRRRIRLEQLILLLVRIAIMALLGLFLARPVLSDRGLEWIAGALRSEDKILLLDDSFSTSRRDSEKSAFQREIDALGLQIRKLADRGGGDRLTVLRGSRHKTPLVRGVFVDAERALQLAQTTSRLVPSDTRLPLAEALQSIIETSARENSGSSRPRAISILTDLRAIDWQSPQGAADEALHQALLQLASSEESPTRILVLDCGRDAADNVAITAVSVEGGRPVAEIPADVRVEVHNFGTTVARGLGLRLRYAIAPANLQAERTATSLGPPIDELGPGRSASVTIPCTFRSVGWYGVTAELTGARDGLPGDDNLSLAVEVVAATEVLLVSGEPSSEPFEGETDFLAAALSPPGEVASGVKPNVVLEDALGREDLSRYSMVYVANVHSLPAETVAPLTHYVREGGTLVLFLGDQSDAALWNRQLGASPGRPADAAADGGGLLPARLGSLREAEEPWGFVPEVDAPCFRPLRDAKDLIAMVRFSKAFELEPLPGAQVLARLSDGAPLLVERSAGRGRVIVCASTADLEWNDWPRNPSYLMTFQEITSMAGRARAETAQPVAGRPVRVPVDVSTYALQARLQGPNYPSEPETTITAAPAPPEEAPDAKAGGFRFEIRDTDRAGLYALGLRSQSGVEEWRQIAVRRDPLESSVERVSAARIAELYPDVPITVVKDAGAFSDVGRGGFEISDVLLVLFGAFLLVEALLARLFAHHARAAAAPSLRAAAPGAATIAQGGHT
jgi:hypothetical protein